MTEDSTLAWSLYIYVNAWQRLLRLYGDGYCLWSPHRQNRFSLGAVRVGRKNIVGLDDREDRCFIGKESQEIRQEHIGFRTFHRSHHAQVVDVPTALKDPNTPVAPFSGITPQPVHPVVGGVASARHVEKSLSL